MDWGWGRRVIGLDKRERNLYFMNNSRRNCGKLIIYICFIKCIRFCRRDYLFCISRRKERELFTEITRCVGDHEKLNDLFTK